MTQKIDLEQVFQNFLQEENLENKKILLMVSGGVDSMVLLEVASQIIEKKYLAVFHLDHNLRKNSKEDFIFVQNICKKLDIKFFGEVLNSRPVSKSETGLEFREKNQNKNLENSWRKSRKKLSQNSAGIFGAQKILTAHHATDLVETMIFRITKGCSVNGLSPFDQTTKPFWRIPKSRILDYAKKNNISWVEDNSNENLDFERNLIRKKVLPELRKITPNLEKVFVNESILFSETQEYLDLGVDMVYTHHEKNILLEEFLSFPSILQKEFLQKISQTTCSYSEIKDGLKWLKNKPKGNSEKKLGKNILRFKDKKISWE